MKKGSKIVCVNDHNQDSYTPCVVKGEIYIIRGFSPITTGVYLEGIFLDEMSNGIERAFLRSRFREIDDSFGEEVLSNIIEQIAAEELICS